MKKENKDRFLIVAFGVTLYAVLMNLKAVLGAVSVAVGYFMPFFAGVVIAFVLDVPARGFQRLLKRFIPRIRSEKILSASGVVLTLVSFAAVIAIISWTVVPVVVSSVRSAYNSIVDHIPGWLELLESKNIDTTHMKESLSSVNFDSLIDRFGSNAGSMLSGVAGAAVSTITGIVTFITGLIIAIYMLMDKRNVLGHSEKLLRAAFSEKNAGRILRITDMISTTYSRFLSGQCLEAAILGILMFIVLALCRIPYAALTAVLTGVFSFIPYVGPFIACGIGGILLLITTPGKVILFIALFLLVQFVEEQFIYPHVVGNYVGLSPLITFVSVLVGGNLFGLIGMIFFLPLVSVFYTLVGEWVRKRTEQKKQ